VPIPDVALGYMLRWPWLKNHGVFETGGASSRVFTEAWYDAKARPKKPPGETKRLLPETPDPVEGRGA